MTQFFYSDPLAAAWMAREFGLQYQRGDQCIIGWKDFSDLQISRWDAPFYLHPSSLPLLEVQLNDMVSDGINGIAVLLEVQLEQCRGAVIIQRGGVQFMWPAQEAA